MKKLILFCTLLFYCCFLWTQQTQPAELPDADKFAREDLKMLVSEQEEEVKVEIRKPDDSSLMPRQVTDFDQLRRRRIRQKIKKSNRMLYNK